MQPQTKRQSAKPALDEQAFQQLLSAAYVMQEHNARLKKSPISAKPSFDVSHFPDPQSKTVATVRPEPETPSAPTMATGCTTQKNWASLWEMHQADAAEKGNRADAPKMESAANVEEDVDLFPAELEEIVTKYGQDEAAFSQAPAKAILPAENAPHRILEETALATIQPGPVAQHAPIETTASSPWVSARKARAWLESLHPDKANKDWLKHQWQESRGNFYIAGAAFVLLVVLVQWLTTTPAQPTGGPRQLSAIEQLMVNMGIAEAPPVPQEYHGNPNTNVWVDMRTGLYYCPGAELYGKSKDGKVTSQLDAQRDQFQPSTLKPCD